MNTTPWFERGEIPCRSGLYQIKGAHRIWWAYWDDDACLWGSVSETQEGAVGWRNRPSVSQLKTWRGVLKA